MNPTWDGAHTQTLAPNEFAFSRLLLHELDAVNFFLASLCARIHVSDPESELVSLYLVSIFSWLDNTESHSTNHAFEKIELRIPMKRDS
jgi:hypothetical protein